MFRSSSPAKPTVEAVVINCFRPDNVHKILRAIAPQVRMTTVLDCALQTGNWASDRTVRFTPKQHDMGPWTRYAAAGLYEQDHTLLIDDDLLPHPDMVDRFLAHAGQYDLVCAAGRLVLPDGSYRPGKAPSGEADIAVRCYFWRTTALRKAVAIAMSRFAPAERWHDDDIVMSLCLDKKVFIIQGDTPWSELPDANALSSKSGHIERRVAFCRRYWNRHRAGDSRGAPAAGGRAISRSFRAPAPARAAPGRDRRPSHNRRPGRSGPLHPC